MAAARASAADGFGALLRYDGALPGTSELTEVGDELVSLPFWNPEFCATVISAAEALGAWTADPTDPVPGHEVSLAVLCPRLFAHVEDHVAALVVPRLRYHWPTLEFHGLRDAFVIKYTEREGEGLRLHHDIAQLSRVGQPERWRTGAGPSCSPARTSRNIERAGRSPLGVAVAGHPPARRRAGDGGREVRAHDLVRAAGARGLTRPKVARMHLLAMMNR